MLYTAIQPRLHDRKNNTASLKQNLTHLRRKHRFTDTMQSADQSTTHGQPTNTTHNATSTTTGGLHISEPAQTPPAATDSFHRTLPPLVQRQYLQDAEYHRLYDLIGHLYEAKRWLDNQPIPAHEDYWKEVTGRGLMLAVERVEEDLARRGRVLTEEYAEGGRRKWEQYAVERVGPETGADGRGYGA